MGFKTTLSILPILALALSQQALAKAPVYAKGRIIIETQAGLSDKDLDKILSEHGGGKKQKLGHSNLHIVNLPDGVSEQDAVEKLSHNPHIKFAERDQRIEMPPEETISNDPYLNSEWHIAKIGATSAWDFSVGSGIIIAILDSGIDSTHPDLAPNIVPGYNVYDNNTNTSEVCGHGTKVAGAAAAINNNAAGVSGVAGQAKIMPVRITDLSCYAYFSSTANGIIYAADHGARVVNVSYGYTPLSTAAQSAANYLRSKGGLLFDSTGNNAIDENITPTDTMISVSSTDSSDNLSSFSSWGNFTVLSAPGSGIYTTVAGGGYGFVNGTSFSSPIAAATAALVMAANPSLSADQVQNILFTTAADLGTAGRDNKFGYGRVDAARAVAAARSAQPPSDSQAPSVSITSPTGGSTVKGLASIQVSASDNVGVARVDLKVNGGIVATDNSSPFVFSWDSTSVADGTVSFVAVAYDAAGNQASSSSVSIKVANAPVVADTIAPTVSISNPVNGAVISGNSINVSISAADNMGAAGISLSLYIDGALKAQGTGATLTYNWNIRKLKAGAHTIQVIARDAAGNSSSASAQVNK